VHYLKSYDYVNVRTALVTNTTVAHTTHFMNKKAELTPGLARDRVATWRLIWNLDSSGAIERVTCGATWRKR